MRRFNSRGSSSSNSNAPPPAPPMSPSSAPPPSPSSSSSHRRNRPMFGRSSVNTNNTSNTSNNSNSKHLASNSTGSLATSDTTASTLIPESVQKELLQVVETLDIDRLKVLLRQHPKATEATFVPKLSKSAVQETLLSYSILQLAPLPVLQVIYQAGPTALMAGNSHGMSALHQASTVATPLAVMEFLVTSLIDQSPERMSVGHLAAPGNWTVLHTACRCGALPVDSFQFLLGHARKALDKKTADKQSTPLHLAIFGLSNRSISEQRVILQHLVQAYPYAVNITNSAGYTPVHLAQHQARKKTFPPDMVGLLLDVQQLAKRKYATRVQVELAIEKCQAKMDALGEQDLSGFDDPQQQVKGQQQQQRAVNDNTAATECSTMSSSASSTTTAASGATSSASENGISANSYNSNCNSKQRPAAAAAATDKKAALRQGMLAHIEMQMLLPLRKKIPSEVQLRELVAEKAREQTRLAGLGPKYLAQTMALNEELIQLEAKVQREVDALVPQEMQATRRALYERLQATAHMPPINNVSLQFLKLTTEHFSEINRIGKGGFGSVYRAYDPVKCAQYAVKKTDKTDDPSLLREVQVLSNVFHPNVVKLLGFYLPPGGQAPEFLVYEFGAGGTIADRVSSDENRKGLTWSIRLSAAAGVASGLNYLHHGMEHVIYHHDVKPENIVFNETLDRAILIDCGISKLVNRGAVSFHKTMAGTPFYLPDDYNEDTPYDEKCEVFSFGMVLRVLIAGKLPRSLKDRTTELVADPLAGTWPKDVLEQFMQMTMKCVSAEPDDRPTIDELYRNLQQLENNAESKMTLTEQQKETIDETLAESRQLSRASRNLQAFGKCDCARVKKQGLYCPGKIHFQCSECFNKHVLDFLGEDVYCREAGCTCTDPWTLDELHHHLRRSVLCRHIESLIRNRELAAYKANNRILSEVGRGFDRVMAGITNIAKDELQCPLLALLIPARSERKRSVMQRAMRSWETSTSKTFFMYFLCAHDRSLVQAPIQVSATRDWVKSAAPFLRAVLAGLQIAVLAAGIPIAIPIFDYNRTGDGLTANLEVLDQMLMDVSGRDGGHGDRNMQVLLNQMQSGDAHLSHDSYRMVAAVANQPGNTTWRDKMVLAERHGELAWVRNENESKWKRAAKR